MRKEQLAEVGEYLGGLLARNQIPEALSFAQQLLTRTPGIAESLLESVSPITSSRLKCLFMDIFAGYPQTIYAAPVCLQIVENSPEITRHLPEASSQMEPSGQFCLQGWLPVTGLQPYDDSAVASSLAIPSSGICSVLAIFQALPDVEPAPCLKLNPVFWAALFKTMPYCVHASIGALHTLPVAQSIANAMADSIAGRPVTAYPFADEALLDDARRTAISFREASVFS